MFWIPRPLLAGALRTPARARWAPVRADLDLSAENHFVECVSAEEIGNYVLEWNDLATRTLEANVFLDPAFALAASTHLSDVAAPEFLLVWQGGDVEARGRLIGLWPLLFPKILGSTAKAWVHDYSCCGGPLLDRDEAFQAARSLFKWLKNNRSKVYALQAAQLYRTGETFGVLAGYARDHGLDFQNLDQYERAGLKTRIVGLGARDFISPKKRKELQRQFRRLRELGAINFTMAHEGAALRDKIEAFMEIEARGWKGQRGGAFLNRPGHATFLRAMTRTMGLDGKCRVYALSLGDRMIAANIVLLSRGTAFFWKTAYDEEFASASPGVLLTLDMTDRLMREPHVEMADSCAIPDHPMIDHIWRGRLRMADVMMSLSEGGQKAFHAAKQREQFRRRLRDKAKTALERLRS